MPDKQRVLIIGLDGATFTLLQPLIDRGSLPNLGSIQAGGVWGQLISTVPPVTAPAWASFMTGRNPAQHGVFGFFDRDASGYTYEETAGFVHGGLIRGPTIWDLLSDAGKRVGVVNVPLTYPPRPVNGLMITGMLTPPSAKTFTYPPELAQRLEGYRIDLAEMRTERGFNMAGGPDEEELIEAVTELLNTRASHCMHLMSEPPLGGAWDCFTVVFVGTDRLFHTLWHYLDPDSQAYGSARGERIRASVEEYLARLDRVIGQLREAAGPETLTLVMSDHGFGPAPTKRVNLNDWLAELGLLHLAGGRRRWLNPEAWATALGLRRPAIKRVFKRWFPGHLLRRATMDKRGGRELPADWRRTRAYAVQVYNHFCGIEINVAGKKRQGIVEPGFEYEQLRDHLLAELENLRDPSNAVKLVTGAFRREDLLHGDYQSQAPDIIIELDPAYTGLAPLGNGQLVTPHQMRRSGDHRREGILLAQGPDAPAGFLSPSPGIIDLAPTILYALGVAVPCDMDGRVLTELFSQAYLERNPILYSDVPTIDTGGGEDVYSSEEMAEISDRLRRLGYMS